MATSMGSRCALSAPACASRMLGAALLLAWLSGCSSRPATDTSHDPRAAARALQSKNSIAAVAPAPGELVLRALLVTPGMSDANGDGEVDPVTDESVTLASRLAAPLDLAGVALHDATGPRYVFPAGAYLPPGGEVVVYGSDAPLSLDDEGDRVRLVSASGATLHEVQYTRADVVNGHAFPDLSPEGPSPSPALATSALLGHGRVFGAFDSNSPGTSVEDLPRRQVGSRAWSCPLPFPPARSLVGHGRVFGAFESNSPGTTAEGALRWRTPRRARPCPISMARAG